MIGSISKIRPCGHHHYYKYAHVKNEKDIKKVDENWKQDATLIAEKVWDYPLTNLATVQSLFRNVKTGDIVRVNFNAPNCTAATEFCFQADFGGSNSGYTGNGIEEVWLNAPNITSLSTFVYLSTNLKKFEMIGDTGKKLTSLSYFGEGSYNLTDWTHHNFSNVTNISNAFMAARGTQPTFRMECDFRNVVYGDRAFQHQGVLSTLRHAYKVDENGNKVWLPQEYDENGNAIHPWMYNEFPSLTTGDAMFNGCKLDKPTTLSILNSLKTFTSGTHKLTMGIHCDLIYDKDVNTALKRVCLNYAETPELYGVKFNEEVTSDKGWTVTTQWNGSYTEKAVPQPEYHNDDVVLPDGYLICDYLEDNGTQWIETNYIPTNETGLYVVAKQITYADGFPMGSYYDSNGVCAPRVLTTLASAFCFGGYLSSATRNIFTNRYFYGLTNWLNSRKGEWRLGAYVSSGAVNTLSFTPTNSIHIFRSNMSGSTATRLWKGRIYRAKISEGSEIVRDYVPCLDPDGKPCMRDVINGVDYYNQGTGDDFTYEIYEGETPIE